MSPERRRSPGQRQNPEDGRTLEDEVRALFGDRWAATGALEDVLVVAVVDAADDDLTRLQRLVPGAGLVTVTRSRAQLETDMDAIEAELTRTGELAGFLQMVPDGFTGTISLTVDAPVPQLQAWAAGNLPHLHIDLV